MNKLDEMISGLPEAAKEYIEGKKLDEVEGVKRIRISSIEPNLLKNETIDFVAHRAIHQLSWNHD